MIFKKKTEICIFKTDLQGKMVVSVSLEIKIFETACSDQNEAIFLADMTL